ncbi:unknown [Prevotella sp. CAG:1031]|nr:unknown [Prevotella sp. CAG:1031]
MFFKKNLHFSKLEHSFTSFTSFLCFILCYNIFLVIASIFIKFLVIFIYKFKILE